MIHKWQSIDLQTQAKDPLKQKHFSKQKSQEKKYQRGATMRLTNGQIN